MKIVPRCPELRVAMGLEDATDKGKGMNFAPIIDGTATPMDIQEVEREDSDQDVGGAFNYRDPGDDAPTIDAEDQKPPQDEPPPAPPPVPPRPIPPAPPAFEAYLLDEVGDFDPGTFTDPVAWAEGFIDLWHHARDKATLIANNEDGLEACKAFPDAAEILAAMDARPAPAQPIAVALKNRTTGRPDWADYVNGFRHLLNAWQGELAQWLTVQRPIMEQAPLPTRLLLVKAVRERGDQLKAGLPDWVIELAAPAKPAQTESTPTRGGLHLAPDPEPKRSDDDLWVNNMMNHLRLDVKNLAQWQELGTSPNVQVVMTRLRRENPDLFAKLDNAFVARRKELGPANEDPPPAAA
jgi:hypothetical protein